jgi:DNA sulfur modification protein DndC
MSAMIQNDHEKEWMRPLLELRNELDVPDDKPLRDFRRMDGRVQLFHEGTIPGPYTQKSRENWLRTLLQAQKWAREHGPEDVSNIELITPEELHEIRRIWLIDKHEIEDILPRIFFEETGEIFEGPKPQFVIQETMFETLREICEDDELQYQMIRDLISVETKYTSMAKRSGLFEELEKSIKRSFYGDKADAMEYAESIQQLRMDLSGSDEDTENQTAVSVRSITKS